MKSQNSINTTVNPTVSLVEVYQSLSFLTLQKFIIWDYIEVLDLEFGVNVDLVGRWVFRRLKRRKPPRTLIRGPVRCRKKKW